MTRDRLPEGARPFAGERCRWDSLVDVVPHTAMQGGLALSRSNSVGVDGRDDDASPLVEISSGGSVFFCVLDDNEVGIQARALERSGAHSRSALARFQVVVLKFVSERLLCQSELFAAEIAHHLDVNGPRCRILLPYSDEWSSLKAACYSLHEKERGGEQGRCV